MEIKLVSATNVSNVKEKKNFENCIHKMQTPLKTDKRGYWMPGNEMKL